MVAELLLLGSNQNNVYTGMNMLTRFVKAGAVLAAALLLWSANTIVPISADGIALAQQTEKEDVKTRKTPAMREKVYKRLSEAQELVEAGDVSGAINVLDDVKGMRDLNSYEVAQMWNFYGFIYYSAERYKESIKAYETVLQQTDIPVAMETNTLYTIAQLYFTIEDYKKAEQALLNWFKVAEDPGADAYVLLGQALYQQQRYKDAIAPVEKAISMAQADGKQVKENWWLLLRVFYYELENYPKVAEFLEILVRDYPKKEYWTQLSGVYGELGKSRKQLYAYEIAYMQGFLTKSSELVTLAQLFMQENVPYKGAMILEKGMKDGIVDKDYKNYRLLAQAYQVAREDKKSIAPLTEAAKLSDDGELYYRLAQAYANLDQWNDSITAVQKALEKGGLKRPDSAQVLMGMAYFNLERYAEAERAFMAAAKDKRSSGTANQWVAYISKERERQAELARALAALK